MPAVERDELEELKIKLRELAGEYSWDDIDQALEEIAEDDEEGGDDGES